MNKKPLTQSQYEKVEAKLKNLRLKLKEKKMTKDEAIQFMVVSMRYGKGRATEIVKSWSRHFYNDTNVRHYNPNPVMAIVNKERIMKSETDLGIEKEML